MEVLAEILRKDKEVLRQSIGVYRAGMTLAHELLKLIMKGRSRRHMPPSRLSDEQRLCAGDDL